MTPESLQHAMDATWPAARLHEVGPWLIREGQGGGKRVSAASARAAWQDGDIDLAEKAQIDLGQERLFLIRKGDEALDQALDRRGYRIVDPVIAYAIPCADLAEPAPPAMAAFPHWPPLAICRDIWAELGISAARIRVMERAQGPKCAILARTGDQPSGVAFVSVQGDVAMLHALEVRKPMRRQGSAHNILRRAANWALENGAKTFSLVVTEANDPARKLYASLNMQVVGQYQYRLK